jgi:hypothetical protein
MVFQFNQNELGRFRASFDLTIDNNDELVRRAQPTASEHSRVVRPASDAEEVLVRQGLYHPGPARNWNDYESDVRQKEVILR